MSKRIFTKEQIEELSKNMGVSKCSEKSITYSNNFKTRAVKLYMQGLTSNEIFKLAGFDLCVIGRKTPKECLKRWNKTYKIIGTAGLTIETRGRGGGRPKTKNLTPADRIKRLETEVAYLKAENNFLAKLRVNKKR